MSVVLRVIERSMRAEPEKAKPEVVRGRKSVRFDSAMLLRVPGVKKFKEIKDGDEVTDYRNVEIKGYLSTFNGADRQGDVVKPGAFKEAISEFMRNPVLLVDHFNSARAVAGSFDVVREDDKGLYVEATLSNSPGELQRDTRFKVAEGHLGALSMGGFFHYDEDGKTISKVNLYEGSLVAIPANREALFTVREATPEDFKAHGLAQFKQGETQ